jgi:hypothetical protein
MSTIDGVLDFEAKQGEKLIIAKVLLGADGNPADLSGLTVKFNMRRRGQRTPLIDHGACTIVGAATLGSVLFTGAVGTTATAGEMEGEFVTLDGSNVPQYFPDAKDTYLFGYITPAIA